MLLKIFILLLAAAVAAAGGHYVMKFFLQRNAALLREYELEPGRVCHPLTLFLGMAVMLLLGAALPQSVVGKVLSCLLLCWLWLLWLIDWRYQFIFDDMVLPLAVLCFGAAVYTQAELWQHVLTAVVIFAALAALAILGRGALGGGDVKLMAALALLLGVEGTLLALCIGFMLGGVAALVLLVLRKAGRKDFFAFGPFLIIGTVLAWMTLALNW